MSNDASLNAGAGCSGQSAPTATPPENPPGLAALAYRVGTHGRFNAALQAALATQPALRALTTRDPSDPSIALLDSWATVLDVLTFYQERIANEGFLRTATERRSILELARAIGYELRPGVAAGTCLAFTLDHVPGSPESVQLAAGTRAQSVPGQDEKPQTFETIEAIEARPEWNQLLPQRTVSSLPLQLGSKKVYLKGTATGLKEGDALLFIGDERSNNAQNENWDFRRVAALATFPLPPTDGANAGYTEITLDRGLGTFSPIVGPAQKNPRVYALRQRASVFGYNASDWKALPDVTRLAYLGRPPTGTLTEAERAEWPRFDLFNPAAKEAHELHLDAIYPQLIARRGWLVLSTPEYQEVFRIDNAVESARAEFGLSGKTTRITLGAGENHDRFTHAIRTAVVYAGSEELEFAHRPRNDAVSGGEVLLAKTDAHLQPGRLLSVSGVSVITGESVSEVVPLKAVESIAGTTRLTFTTPLREHYRRDTATINANVARATHGETKPSEVLGSGDGSRPFQRFHLKQKPLTYVSAPVASGAASTLEIRVKGVRWHEVPSLYGATPADRVFTARLADDGTTTVLFGDGATGARLPTGTNTITANYRTGVGLEGAVDAGKITTLLSRPLGLKGVTNPVAATGAGDPEQLADARANAPLTVLTLGRVVSRQDFEDFARAFAGIGKSRATLQWNGERPEVHLTIAAADGSRVDPASELYQNLVAGLNAARHTDQSVRVLPHAPRTFSLAARVAAQRDYLKADVFAAIRRALGDAFSFARREFGQGVTASEILAIMQNVEGVVAVDLDRLDGRNPIERPNLPAQLADSIQPPIRGAELLLIDPAGIHLTDLPL